MRPQRCGIMRLAPGCGAACSLWRLPMTTPASSPALDIVRAAEQILTVTFGDPVRLGPAEPLRERDTVFRCAVLAGPAGMPASVVVKRPTPRDDRAYDPTDADFLAIASRLFNEWAGLQLLQEHGIAPPVAPRFYGGD